MWKHGGLQNRTVTGSNPSTPARVCRTLSLLNVPCWRGSDWNTNQKSVAKGRQLFRSIVPSLRVEDGGSAAFKAGGRQSVAGGS